MPCLRRTLHSPALVRAMIGAMEEATFDSNGVAINYAIAGAGEPLVLVHGFAANKYSNWIQPGWVEDLSAIRRVIALDCRGHGRSDKPHDPAMYGTPVMAGDVVRMMDHLGIESADVFGYSMGGMISLRMLVDHPARCRKVVLGGIGSMRSPAARGRPSVVEGLLAKRLSDVKDTVARGFRILAEANGADLEALAACMGAGRAPVSDDDLAGIASPVLVAVGADDAIIADPEKLAEAIPGARFVSIPGKDHVGVVVDQRLKDAVVAFLKA